MTNQIENNERREYRVGVSGQLIKHLGLQMYSGAVPAIVELISNSYDAMAKNVWITIPVERPIKTNDQIVVKDDGHGMTYEECNNFYLQVGRDRRKGNFNKTKPYNGLNPRKIQGRKGIGKLAGFGIADQLSIYTVRDEEISCFVMEFSKLTESEQFANLEGYSPTPLPEDGQRTTSKPCTIVTLDQLKITRKIEEETFKRSIARRLLVLDESFNIYINGNKLSRDEIPFQFRFPNETGSWETDKLENGEEIQWWAGFSKKTIPEEEQRGLVVYVRGKLAQTPWFFDLSGGIWGQHGLQYLTGEIKADFLDDEVDLIATDRGGVQWENSKAIPLKKWGQDKIKELLNEWVVKRVEKKQKSPTVIKYKELAEKLPKKERDIFHKVVNRICSIPQIDKDEEGTEIADMLVEVAYDALINRNFLEIIRHLKTLSSEDHRKISDTLADWDIIEAINTAQLVKGRLEIINKFQQMIDENYREKPDMQDYLREHPWLIDPKWTTLAHEQSLDNVLHDKFELPKSGTEDGSRRPDFVCLGDGTSVYVVEVKRPGKTITEGELHRLVKYVYFLREYTGLENQVKGLLIADKTDSHKRFIKSYENDFQAKSWKVLLSTAYRLHEKFFNVVKGRAPAGDPRIENLSELDSQDNFLISKFKR